jgi:hypothetical protein
MAEGIAKKIKEMIWVKYNGNSSPKVK